MHAPPDVNGRASVTSARTGLARRARAGVSPGLARQALVWRNTWLMDQLRFYRPLARSVRPPSDRREAGLYVAVVGAAILIATGWPLADEMLAGQGRERSVGQLAGTVPFGVRGSNRQQAVYVWQDAAGQEHAALGRRTITVRTAADSDPGVAGLGALIRLDRRPFPQQAPVAYDPADPRSARVLGEYPGQWRWAGAGLLVLVLGLWMRRTDAQRDSM
jgi:hypothetical protein